ncbi:MAG: hypothetical protein R6V47_07545 [Candidatus Delongbacteria bacterium]
MRHKLHLNRYNYFIFAAGIILLAVGYYLMGIGPYDSFWSLTLAPIIVMFSYTIVFPYGILKNFRKDPRNKEKKLDNKGN